MVSPSSFSSSSGPCTASRSCRLSSEIRWAAAVIWRTGLSARPATSQPSPTEITVMIASAISDEISSTCESLFWSGWMAAWDWS